ncbi:MAG: DUF2357 domain-containing protein [Acidaminococcaceae bacterium]
MKRESAVEISLDKVDENLALYIDAQILETIFVLDEEESFYEAKYQLLEGHFYNYEFTKKGYSFKNSKIVQENTRHSNMGVIAPNVYVGTIILDIFNEEDFAGNIEFEVRSVKLTYHEDYRLMLEDITESCTEILMEAEAISTHSFANDYEKQADPNLLYQRFAFVKSLVSEDEFHDAIHAIVSAPILRWTRRKETRKISQVKKITKSVLRQIGKSTRRNFVGENCTLNYLGIDSMPEYAEIETDQVTVDSAENAFVKYVLENFYLFSQQILSLSQVGSNLRKESLEVVEYLDSILTLDFFKSISRCSSINLNNPALQRRSGYREILKKWLQFDLASKLIWQGGDDVYKAGKKDIALLYEYWLFFKLLGIFSQLFGLEIKNPQALFEYRENGLNLRLKKGTHIELKGMYKAKARKFYVKFSYNRTFRGCQRFPEPGSWSVEMRPDYTLSFWPAGFQENEAEKKELIVHIHFDAKYKINQFNFIQNLTEADADPDEFILNQLSKQQGKFKNEDILKMHAYKDAIRRTGGAYILYPGTEDSIKHGFHEIIPGLGAFAFRPSRIDDGRENLIEFILKVIENFENRASRREQISYKIYDVNKNKTNVYVKETIPEYYREDRMEPLNEVHVLVAYIQEKQKQWVQQNGLYNIRINQQVMPEFFSSKYLLLFDGYDTTGNLKYWQNGLYEIVMKPTIKSKQWLLDLKYPKPGKEEYFIYNVNKQLEGWSMGKICNIKVPGAAKRYSPFTITLGELLGDESTE